MSTLEQVKKEIEKIKEFGDIPRYSVELGRKYIYIWLNNGQVPATRNLSKLERLSGWSGYATFIGRFTPEEAEELFLGE